MTEITDTGSWSVTPKLDIGHNSGRQSEGITNFFSDWQSHVDVHEDRFEETTTCSRRGMEMTKIGKKQREMKLFAILLSWALLNVYIFSAICD